MEEKEIKQSFQDYVNENYEEYMHSVWPMIKPFTSAEVTDELQFKFEIGFIMALGWVGKLLGVELAQPSEEERAIMDKIFIDM